jgi:hypothetical protein
VIRIRLDHIIGIGDPPHDPLRVRYFGALYAAGVVLPPVTVSPVGDRWHLCGGLHRVLAQRLLGRVEIDAPSPSILTK